MKQFVKDLSIPAIMFMIAMVAGACLIPPEAHADVCASYTNTNNDSINGTLFIGAPFTPSVDCGVTDMKMYDWMDSGGTVNDTYFIYSDSGGSPGTVLVTGSTNLISSATPVINDSTADGSVVLTAGTQYWLVADKTTSSSEQRGYFNTGVASVSKYSSNGSSWTAYDRNIIFEVDGTVSGGGGGGATTTPDLTATSTIEQSQTNLFYAVDIYFMSMVFVVWFFKRRS